MDFSVGAAANPEDVAPSADDLTAPAAMTALGSPNTSPGEEAIEDNRIKSLNVGAMKKNVLPVFAASCLGNAVHIIPTEVMLHTLSCLAKFNITRCGHDAIDADLDGTAR
jgi:hypothetical protein